MSRASCLIGLSLFLGANVASAAQRCVMIEEFTATWCGPCKPVGVAFGELLDAATPNMAYVQIHTEDIYESPWGYARRCFYGYCDPSYAFPTVYYDGIQKLLGTQSKATYEAALHNRETVPTDVTIDIWASENGSQIFDVYARVGIEPGGTAKNMRVHIIQVLDNYPLGGTDYRNCWMQANVAQDISLAPGQSQDVHVVFPLTGPNWTYKEKTRIIAWAQTVKATWPAEIFQANMTNWPFPDAPPGATLDGDLDGDGDVDQSDLGIMLSDYGCTGGDCPGDADGDGDTDQSDLGILLANYGK